MDNHKLGKIGEAEAANYLRKNGFKILHTNWYFQKAELDIVAENEKWVVVVEVKTRTGNSFGNPEDFVSKKQQKLLIKAANQYAEVNGVEKEMRFDIISILVEPKFQLQHIPEAFYP